MAFIVESGGISIKVSEFELHQVAWKRQLVGKWDLVSRQVGLPSTAKLISTEFCSDQQLFKRYIYRWTKNQDAVQASNCLGRTWQMPAF